MSRLSESLRHVLDVAGVRTAALIDIGTGMVVCSAGDAGAAFPAVAAGLADEAHSAMSAFGPARHGGDLGEVAVLTPRRFLLSRILDPCTWPTARRRPSIPPARPARRCFCSAPAGYRRRPARSRRPAGGAGTTQRFCLPAGRPRRHQGRGRQAGRYQQRACACAAPAPPGRLGPASPHPVARRSDGPGRAAPAAAPGDRRRGRRLRPAECPA